MTTELPAPPFGSDVDLRDFAFMPLDVVRLRDSDLAASATGEEFRAAVLLWCASWHQIPAASLPDDDAVLSSLAGFGRVVKEWQKVKRGALRKWFKCSDGRLYHPTVVEKAREALEAKKKQRDRTAAARAAKMSQATKNQTTEVVTKIVTSSVTENVTSSKGQGQGQGQLLDNLPAQQPTTCAIDENQSERPTAAAAPGKNELDSVENACRAALSEKSPVDLVIGPMVEIVRKYGQERVILCLQSEARRARRNPVKSWKLWAQIVGEELAEQPKCAATPPPEAVEWVVFLNNSKHPKADVMRAIEAWNRGESWGLYGERPPYGHGCKIPPEYLAMCKKPEDFPSLDRRDVEELA